MRPLRIASGLTAAGVLILTLPMAPAQGEEAKVNFKDNVSAIFQAKCNSCHNTDKKKGGLALDSYAGAMEGGASGPVIEPGDPDNSRLFLLVSHEEEPAMPPSSPKLPDEMLNAIKAWITVGAPETSGSVVAMKEKSKLDFTLDPAAMGKPQGEPALPSGILTEPVIVTERPNAILAMASSPWSPLLAVASHKQILLYNTQTFQLCGILPFDIGTIHCLKFTRDGGILLAAGGVGGQSGLAAAWDVKSGEKLFEVGKEYDSVLAADISPNRNFVAVGGPSKMLRVYNTADGELAYECKKHTEWITSVAFSPDGVLLASGDRNGGLVVWEAYTGREFYDLRGHTAMITGSSWRLDSNVLASSSEDGSIKLWNMLDGNQLKSWGAHGGGAEDVRFAKDGRLISTGRDRVTKLWDQNGKAERQFETFGDIGLQSCFTFDDSTIVAGDWSGEIRVWNTADGKQIGNLVANPAPVAVRLERARQEYIAAQSAADAAGKELEPLKAVVADQVARVNQATQARDEAQKDVAMTEAIRVAAEKTLTERDDTAKSAAEVLEAAEVAEKVALTSRTAAEAFLLEKLNATNATIKTLVTTRSDADRESAVQLAAATTEAARAAESALASLIESSRKVFEAQIATATATAIRADAAKHLDQTSVAVQAASVVLATRIEELEAMIQAREAAEKALAEKSPAVQTIIDRAIDVKARLDALNSELQAVEKAKATPGVATASDGTKG